MALAAPPSTACDRAAVAALAPLFAYPRRDFAARLDAARGALAETCTTALESFERFASWSVSASAAEREQTYTATFDLAPACAPYLGEHLFSPASPERVQLMLGLRQVARRAGRAESTELPDHLAEVLASGPAFEIDEWSDLARLCLAPALDRMVKALAPAANPYRELLAAARELVGAAAREEAAS